MTIKDTLIENVSKTVSVSFSSVIKLTGGKKNPMQEKVVKHIAGMEAVVAGKQNYAPAYNEAGLMTTDIKPRPWGVRLDNGLIEHKGELYVELLVKSKGKTVYTLDGAPIAKEAIVGLPENKQASEVEVRAVKLSYISKVEVV